jgi:galactokinase
MKNQLKNRFQEIFQAMPEIIVRAPGRINLLGEHLDYNDGFVLPAAIDKAIWLAASRREDGRFAFFAHDLDEYFISDDEKTVFQTEKNWANYLLGGISEARKDGHQFGGLNLIFGGDVPLGAGLSSSAALESGVLFLINELYALGLEKMQIVQLAQRGENHFVGMNCGVMDMFASVMGRAAHVVQLDCRTLEYAYFPLKMGDFSLILLDSGVKHALVDSEYNTRRRECDEGLAILKMLDSTIVGFRDVSFSFFKMHENHFSTTVFRRLKFVLEEIARVKMACAALEKHDLKTLGKLMFETHDGLNLAYEVCCPETNFLVEMAKMQPEMLGARQMGGGFGGCTINLVRTDFVEKFYAETEAQYFRIFSKKLKIYRVAVTDGVAVLED